MIVVIVVIAVVRASNGSSSSRLAVVVGNMRALILKRNPNPNQDAFFRFRPGCDCGSNLRGQLACQQANHARSHEP